MKKIISLMFFAILSIALNAQDAVQAKALPVPVVTFAGISSGIISKDMVQKTQTLEAKFPGTDSTVKLEIVSFKLLTPMGNELSANGNALTDEMKSKLSSLSRGSSLVFKDIKVKFPDGKIKDLSPVILKMD